MNANEIEVGHVPGTMRLSECKGINPTSMIATLTRRQ